MEKGSFFEPCACEALTVFAVIDCMELKQKTCHVVVRKRKSKSLSAIEKRPSQLCQQREMHSMKELPHQGSPPTLSSLSSGADKVSKVALCITPGREPSKASLEICCRYFPRGNAKTRTSVDFRKAFASPMKKGTPRAKHAAARKEHSRFWTAS